MPASDKHYALLRRIFEHYLERHRAGNLEPTLDPLPYDFGRYEGRAWLLCGDFMLMDELRELTNALNRWQQLLERWQAWNDVLIGVEESEAWAVRRQFLESDVHWCLLYPSAIRDAIAFVATNGIHQVRLATEPDYRDFLEGDPTSPGRAPRRLRRQEREAQLGRLTSKWPQGANLVEQLRGLDDRDYRQATRDYRNEHSHALGPSLEIGETQFVRRIVAPATKKVRGYGPYYTDVQLSGQMSVTYAFGGRPPLDMHASRKLNLAQYLRARACFLTYTGLLDAAVQALPQSNSDQSA